MAKKSITDLQISPTGEKIGVEADWFKRGQTILSQITDLIRQYNILTGKTPPETPKSQSKNTPKNPVSNNPTQQNEDKKTQGDLPMKQLLEFCKQFLENCKKQNMGEKPIGQIINELPLTVDQCLLLIQAIEQRGQLK